MSAHPAAPGPGVQSIPCMPPAAAEAGAAPRPNATFAPIDLAAAADAPVAEVGGKGQQLGRLARLGLPVPDGFVIAAPALGAAFADAARDPAAPPPLPDEFVAALDAELIHRGWQHTPLAVRSSAPQEDSQRASFAGIHRSELNVAGRTALARAVSVVHASLWTPQAVAYRQRLGLADTDAAMAVVVMPMLPAVLSGVAFTCDPRSGRDDRIAISAVRGLGEALVGGLESGEEILLEEERIGETLAVVARRPARQRVRIVPAPEGGTRQEALAPPGAEETETGAEADTATLLDDAQALALGRLLRDAAQALDYADPAYDIEWVWDGARFVLVQARPVTARRWHTYPGLAGQGAIWSNGNTRDVVPHVMGAMDWIGWRRMVDLMLEQGYRLAGFPLLPGARRSALHCGRLYLNVSLIQWEGYDALGVAPPAMNRLLGGHHPEIAVPPAGWRDRLARAGRLLRYVRKSGAQRRAGRRETAQAFADSARWRAEDLARLPDDALAARLHERLRYVRTRDGMMFLQGSSGGNLYLLLDLVDRHLPGEGHALVAAVMAGGEPSVSARQAYEMAALARAAREEPAAHAWLRRGAPWELAALPADSAFRRAFSEFVERYGHRGIYESYLRNPRFREDPGYLLDTLAGLLDTDIAALEARRRQAAARAWARLGGALPLGKRLWAKTLVRIAQAEGNDRELARSAFTACSETTRRLLLEAGARLRRRGALATPDTVFDLTPHELGDALNGRLGAAALGQRIAERRARMAAWETQPAPEVIFGAGAEKAAWTTAPASTAESAANGESGVWRGIAVGSGCAEGVARIVRAPAEGTRLAPGEILVAPSTDPAWTPLFLKAGGLVMETGGYLSHGAIVAREFGIPAVVNLPGILDRIEDGQRLRVDGERGEVRRSA